MKDFSRMVVGEDQSVMERVVAAYPHRCTQEIVDAIYSHAQVCETGGGAWGVRQGPAGCRVVVELACTTSIMGKAHPERPRTERGREEVRKSRGAAAVERLLPVALPEDGLGIWTWKLSPWQYLWQ